MKINLCHLLPTRVPILSGIAPVFILSSLLLEMPARASDRWATLEAIHQLENPRNTDEPGRFGELGAYQFREGTWKKYTQAPFTRALDRHSSDAVVVKHYDWIKSELERRSIAVTPYNVALAWNGGLGSALDPQPSAGVRDYATRASNLANELEHHELADAR